jgi:hypothetical protein
MCFSYHIEKQSTETGLWHEFAIVESSEWIDQGIVERKFLWFKWKSKSGHWKTLSSSEMRIKAKNEAIKKWNNGLVSVGYNGVRIGLYKEYSDSGDEYLSKVIWRDGQWL